MPQLIALIMRTEVQTPASITRYEWSHKHLVQMQFQVILYPLNTFRAHTPIETRVNSYLLPPL